MRNFLRKRRLGKRGFTLMEVVVALAVVGIISAMILPLASAAIRSFAAANALRTTATKAETENAIGTSNTKETLYVTVTYTGTLGGSRAATSRFKFTKSTAKDDKYDVLVEYYELKYEE